MTDKVTGQCPQTTTFFEEKGEPKRYRTEVLPLTSLTPYRYAKPAHILTKDRIYILLYRPISATSIHLNIVIFLLHVPLVMLYSMYNAGGLSLISN